MPSIASARNGGRSRPSRIVTDPAAGRVRATVIGWVRHHAADAGRVGAILLEPGTPEGRLLRGWAEEAGFELAPFDRPDLPLPLQVAHAALEWPDHLALAPLHRTRLLLDGDPGTGLPFGDLTAREVAKWAGGFTPPLGLDATEALEVDDALGAALEGADLRAGLAPLGPERAAALELRIRRHAARLRGPMLPKLRLGWSPGFDPPLV